MRRWWQRLQSRERQIIRIGGLLTMLLLAWAFVWHPLSRSRVELTQTVAAQRQALATMRAEASEVVRLRSQGVRGKAERQGKSLLALADASARGASLAIALKRVEPISEKSVRVSFETANFDSLVNWLESLTRDFGVHATDFSVDRVEGVGLVNARITLEEF